MLHRHVSGRRAPPLAAVDRKIGAFYLLAAIMTAASSVIVYAFLTGDYSIRYVQRYSDSAQPLFYKLTSYWGGLDGSIMFWVFLLSLFGSAAIYINRERHRELIPYIVAIISTVEMFFLLLMIVHNNPFRDVPDRKPDGRSRTEPSAPELLHGDSPADDVPRFRRPDDPVFGMAALITGYLDDSWLRAVRRWTMVAWLFLSIGLGLGMIWRMRNWAGAATGCGIQSKMRACSRGSRLPRSCIRSWSRNVAECCACGTSRW